MKNRTAVRHVPVVAVFLVVALAGVASADPVILSMVPADYTSLGATTAATTMLSQTYDDGGAFTGTVLSQVYNTSSGDYLYLYQVLNGGPSALEKEVIFPFAPVDGDVGYLTADEPTGFSAGDQVPFAIVYDSAISVPTIGIDYPSGGGFSVGAGENTNVVYILSSAPPELGESHVVDGGTGSVEVWVPEPATLVVLIGGLSVVLVRRRRK